MVPQLPGPPTKIGGLTEREVEVLTLVGHGLTLTEIAKRLHRSRKTIETHRMTVGRKLGARNRVELARCAIQMGLVSVPVTEGKMRSPARQEQGGGTNFLLDAVRQLSRSLGVAVVAVCEVAAPGATQATVRAMWNRGEFRDAHTGDFAASPCHRAARDGRYHCESKLRAEFPQCAPLRELRVDAYIGLQIRDAEGNTRGVLSVFDDKPISNSPHNWKLMQMIADLLGDEWSRRSIPMDRPRGLNDHMMLSGAIGNWHWDIKNDQIAWSPEVYRAVGWKPQSLEMKFDALVETVVYTDDRAMARRQFTDAIHSGGQIAFTFRVATEDGGVEWVFVQGTSFRDGRHEVARLVGTAQRCVDTRLPARLDAQSRG